MELSWLTRARIAAACAAGIGLIGILAWPLVVGPQPSVPVACFAGTISITGAIILAALAVVTGLVAYFLSWPYGRQIGVVAVPAGLAVWALRSATLARMIQLNPSLHQRQEVFNTMKWEPFFWLGIVACGLAGVWAGRKIAGKPIADPPIAGVADRPIISLNAIIALIASVFLAHLLLKILARDVRIGSIVAQPACAQIAFAVTAAFALVAFAAKILLGVSYLWPTLASGILTSFAVSAYVKQDTLRYLATHLPAVFFPNAVVAILPIQMVAFGTLGSVAGYWLAVRYRYWRKSENQ